MKRVKLFLKKYWYLLAGLVVVSVLLIRRTVVLRALSRLRSKLAGQQDQLDEILYEQDLSVGIDAIKGHKDAAKVLRGSMAVTSATIASLEQQHQTVTGRINSARSWSDLEDLRDEANARE